jgi:1,4-alpha-glucan branching enzyme
MQQGSRRGGALVQHDETANGYLALLLHAHLPFVRHPEYEDFLEERWLFEAITESYIPLLNVFERLVSENVDFRISISLSPPLLSMLTDELLQERYLRHLGKLIEFSEKEIDRTRGDPRFNALALMYHDRFARARTFFEEDCGRNLVAAFRRLQEAGRLEILTSAATHGYLPCLAYNEAAVRAQVSVAVTHFAKLFGRTPEGFWLPECAYYPGVDRILKEAGIRYFILEAHGILHASPRPRFGVYAPIFCPSGVAAFGRDLESSKQVWSSVEGYPGDYYYRDYYRDAGYDLDFDYVRPYIHPDGVRVSTGLKYHRITGKTDDKQPYEPDRGTEKAAEHAGNFMFNRQHQIEYLYSIMDRRPIVVAPYDAELFGHWWFEGPEWLYFLFKKIHYDQTTLHTVTLSEYLLENPVNQLATPAVSSWGWKGYHEVWLEGSNDWTYRHLHKAAERMTELARTHRNPDHITRRALNQAARELLLAQSSDWAFIMKVGTMSSYAYQRITEHILRFTRLYEEITAGRIDPSNLVRLEQADNIFPDIDFSVYA